MRYVLLGLAVFRLSLLLNREAGPGDIFIRLRLALGMRYDEYGEEQPTNPLAQALHCFWCLSVWIGGIFALLETLAPRLAQLLALPLALSGSAVLLNHYLEQEHGKGGN